MSSGFVSSAELDEAKKKRQEEWERVRKPEDPLDAPEPEVCNKSLFEQLRNNREKAQLEKDEAAKLKNMIRGIDEDESEFLSQVSDIQRKEEKAKKQEESNVLREMARARSLAAVEVLPPPPSPAVSSSGSSQTPATSKQASIISSIIKRKSTSKDEETPPKKKSAGEASLSSVAMNAQGGLSGLVEYSSDEEGDEGASSDDSTNSSNEEVNTIPIIRSKQPKKKQ